MLHLMLILMTASVWPTAECGAASANAEVQWGYKANYGPDHWPRLYKRFCSGRRQSPINLNTNEAIYDPNLTRFTFAKPPLQDISDYYVYNDGHKVTVNLDKAPYNISIYNAPEICFRPHEIHWHWGSKDSIGSEHHFNGRQYSMEAHFVTWDCHFYNNMKDGLNGIDGLGVFGIFYEVVAGEPKNPTLQKIIDTFNKPNIRQCNACLNNSKAYEPSTIPPFDIMDLLPENRKDFWRYYGSLTTPDCRENVLWTVFNTPLKIPPEQMEAFRRLMFPREYGVSRPMVDNFRGPLPLNPVHPPGARRQLTRSFKVDGDAQIMCYDNHGMRTKNSQNSINASTRLGSPSLSTYLLLSCFFYLSSKIRAY